MAATARSIYGAVQATSALALPRSWTVHAFARSLTDAPLMNNVRSYYRQYATLRSEAVVALPRGMDLAEALCAPASPPSVSDMRSQPHQPNARK